MFQVTFLDMPVCFQVGKVEQQKAVIVCTLSILVDCNDGYARTPGKCSAWVATCQTSHLCNRTSSIIAYNSIVKHILIIQKNELYNSIFV